MQDISARIRMYRLCMHGILVVPISIGYSFILATMILFEKEIAFCFMNIVICRNAPFNYLYCLTCQQGASKNFTIIKRINIISFDYFNFQLYSYGDNKKKYIVIADLFYIGSKKMILSSETFLNCSLLIDQKSN